MKSGLNVTQISVTEKESECLLLCQDGFLVPALFPFLLEDVIQTPTGNARFHFFIRESD